MLWTVQFLDMLNEAPEPPISQSLSGVFSKIWVYLAKEHSKSCFAEPFCVIDFIKRSWEVSKGKLADCQMACIHMTRGYRNRLLFLVFKANAGRNSSPTYFIQFRGIFASKDEQRWLLMGPANLLVVPLKHMWHCYWNDAFRQDSEFWNESLVEFEAWLSKARIWSWSWRTAGVRGVAAVVIVAYSIPFKKLFIKKSKFKKSQATFRDDEGARSPNMAQSANQPGSHR